MATEEGGPGPQRRGREAVESVSKTVKGVSAETGKALKNFEGLPPYETLQVLGGLIPIGVGSLIFFLRLARVTLVGPLEASSDVFFWIWNLIFGFLVLFAFGMSRRSIFNGAVLGGIFGLLLLFGGVSGFLGGVLAILGFTWGYWARSGAKVIVTHPPATRGGDPHQQ